MNDLTVADLPPVSDHNAIREFAASFMGYSYHGSFASCAQADKDTKRENLIELRTELFWAYRAGNHLGDNTLVRTYEILYPHFRRILSERDDDGETAS